MTSSTEPEVYIYYDIIHRVQQLDSEHAQKILTPMSAHKPK